MGQIGIKNANEQLLINGGLTIFNFLVALGMAFSIDKFGRRPLFLVATIGECLAMASWTVAAQQSESVGSSTAGRAVIGMMFVFMLFYNIAWSGLLIGYVVEISPFYLRSRYITCMLIAVAAGLFFSNYVNPIALERITWKFYICYAVWLFIQSIVVYFFYIETKGRSLETIAIAFDGDDAKVGGGGGTTKGEELLHRLDAGKAVEVHEHIEGTKEP